MDDEKFSKLLKAGRLDIVDRVTGEVVATISPEPQKAEDEKG